jgi:hypothetical protein
MRGWMSRHAAFIIFCRGRPASIALALVRLVPVPRRHPVRQSASDTAHPSRHDHVRTGRMSQFPKPLCAPKSPR